MTVTLFDDAVPALRLARRRRRTAELEWFEVAYRAYLVAMVGGGLVAWLSSFVKDTPLDAAGLTSLRQHAPAIGGLLAAVAVLLGLRSGSRGGPLAIEEAEVRHVLLAPVSRAGVLRRPTVQRVRTLLGTGAAAGAVAGELVGRRAGGSLWGWAAMGAVAGAVIGALFVAAALLTHGTGRPEWQATVAGGVLVALEVLALSRTIPAGPLDPVGGLLIWPLRVRVIDLLAPAVAVFTLALGFAALERFSLELMARRSALVAQLRFAATMQDMRTVMLLRRQLSLEQTREQPWFTLKGRGSAPWRRSVRSLARFPVRRLGRMSLLAIGAAAAEVGAYRGTSPLFLVSGLACFLLGLEAMEPLAQEVDHPDLTESFPIEPGKLHQQLLVAPGILLALVALVGVATAFVMEPHPATLAVAALVGIPAALAGGAGATLNTISGAPDPFSAGTEGAMLPPEMAGMHLAFRSVRPLVVAIVGSVPVLIVRSGVSHGYNGVAIAVRGALGVLVLVVAVVWWVERRATFRRWWRKTLEEGKAQGRSTGAR